MNINKLRKAIRFSLYSCLLTAFGASSMVAQSNEDDKDIHDLSLFTIDATEDTGYVATSTLAGTKLFGGLVTVEDAFGHSPGHAMYRIESAGESLLNITDIAHNDLIMFRNPSWVIGWDHDMGQAVDTRRRVFKQAAQQKTPVFGFHVPWPGLGSIVPRGSGETYDWAPRRLFWA